MSQKTILIIEDSADLADSLEDMLTVKGYLSLKATTGREGIKLALEEKPDLIILDLRLPDIDGAEIFKQIKSDTWGATAKILIITASDFDEKSASDLGIPSEIVMHKSHSSIGSIAKRIDEELLN